MYFQSNIKQKLKFFLLHALTCFTFSCIQEPCRLTVAVWCTEATVSVGETEQIIRYKEAVDIDAFAVILHVVG